MKKIKLLIGTLFIAFTINASAQDVTGNSVSDQTISAADANAKLLVAMKILQTVPLDFGSSILDGTGGGTLVMDADDAVRVYASGLATSVEASSNHRVGVYSVTGGADESYLLTLPSTITITHSGDGVAAEDTMTISLLTVDFTNVTYTDGTGRISAMDATGGDGFKIGGTLTAIASQKSGTYDGTFEISVDYN
jgi:hypothetical protein